MQKFLTGMTDLYFSFSINLSTSLKLKSTGSIGTCLENSINFYMVSQLLPKSWRLKPRELRENMLIDGIIRLRFDI